MSASPPPTAAPASTAPRLPWPPAAWIAISLVLLGGAACLTWLVLGDRTAEFDRVWHETLVVKDQSKRRLILEEFTAMGGEVVLTWVTLAFTFLLITLGRPTTAGWLAGWILGTNVVKTVLKTSIARVRPRELATIVGSESHSFPSGHAMMSLVVYVTVAFCLMELLPTRAARAFLVTLAVVLALGLGASRVLLGVHHPTDVLAGWLYGAASLAVLRAASSWRVRRRAAA